MNKQDTLQRAIELAIANGWERGEQLVGFSLYDHFTVGDEIILWPEAMIELADENDWIGVGSVIFNHDFARALWGEELHHEMFIVPKELNKRFAGTKEFNVQPIYRYHLQQMVIADDPLQYLADNLPEGGKA